MQYRFVPFKNLATGDGFNYPIDVYNGTVYLGTLIVKPDGVTIRIVDTPRGKEIIAQSKNNFFKTQDIAAEVLHRAWAKYRFGGYDSGDTGQTVPAI